MSDAIIGVLALVGAMLVLLAGIGVLRFPDIYSRMHAATKATTLGIALIACAAAVAVDDGRGKILVSAAFIFITAPSAAHFIGRAAYQAEGIDVRLDGPDDLRALVEDSNDRSRPPGAAQRRHSTADVQEGAPGETRR